MFTKLTLTHGQVATLELACPDEGNGFGETLHGEFPVALAELAADTDIRVILLHAQGRMFSAGGSLSYLKALSQDGDLRRRTLREGQELFTRLSTMPVPVVAAVQGHAIGVGATIATSCDVVVAWKDAKFGDPHVPIGLVAGDGGALSWSAAAGATRAKRALLTGDPISAADAYRFGLVTDLVDTPEEAYPAALAIAERIAALPPLAVQGTKRAFNAMTRRRLSENLEIGLLSEMETLASEDFAEAIAAAEARRPGVYSGR